MSFLSEMCGLGILYITLADATPSYMLNRVGVVVRELLPLVPPVTAQGSTVRAGGGAVDRHLGHACECEQAEQPEQQAKRVIPRLPPPLTPVSVFVISGYQHPPVLCHLCASWLQLH